MRTYRMREGILGSLAWIVSVCDSTRTLYFYREPEASCLGMLPGYSIGRQLNTTI